MASSLLLGCLFALGGGCKASRCVSGEVMGRVCAELWLSAPGSYRQDLLSQRRAACSPGRPDACLEAAVLELGGLPFRDKAGQLDPSRVLFSSTLPPLPAGKRPQPLPASVPPLPRPTDEAIDRAFPLLVQVCEAKHAGAVSALACDVLGEGAGALWVFGVGRRSFPPYQVRMPEAWLQSPRPEVVKATRAAQLALQEAERAEKDRALEKALARAGEARSVSERFEVVARLLAFASGEDAQRYDAQVRPVLGPLWQEMMDQAHQEHRGLLVVALMGGRADTVGGRCAEPDGCRIRQRYLDEVWQPSRAALLRDHDEARQQSAARGLTALSWFLEESSKLFESGRPEPMKLAAERLVLSSPRLSGPGASGLSLKAIPGGEAVGIELELDFGPAQVRDTSREVVRQVREKVWVPPVSAKSTPCTQTYSDCGGNKYQKTFGGAPSCVTRTRETTCFTDAVPGHLEWRTQDKSVPLLKRLVSVTASGRYTLRLGDQQVTVPLVRADQVEKEGDGERPAPGPLESELRVKLRAAVAQAIDADRLLARAPVQFLARELDAATRAAAVGDRLGASEHYVRYLLAGGDSPESLRWFDDNWGLGPRHWRWGR